MDLVEVNPMAKPPVCKIMDYGKFKYESKKRANEAKKKQVIIKTKEIKLRPRTDEHDYQVKLRAAREFLEEGHKIKVTIVFRGREIAHREIGHKQLMDMTQDLKDVAVVEQTPRMEGRSMFLLLGANKKIQAAVASAAAASAAPTRPDRERPSSGEHPAARPRPAQTERPATAGKPAAEKTSASTEAKARASSPAATDRQGDKTNA